MLHSRAKSEFVSFGLLNSFSIRLIARGKSAYGGVIKQYTVKNTVKNTHYFGSVSVKKGQGFHFFIVLYIRRGVKHRK